MVVFFQLALELRRRSFFRRWLERLMVMLALVLAATPLELSTERVSVALKKELEAKEVELSAKSEHLIVRFTPAGHARLDAVWKILGSVAQESRKAPGSNVIVEVTGADFTECLRHERLAADYLYGKQRVEAHRVKLEPCEVPDTTTLGALTLEARTFTLLDYSPLSGVAFHFTNGSDAPIEVTIDQLELVPSPRTVALSSFWFRATPEGAITEVKKGRKFSVPAKTTLEVMLRFEAIKGATLAWRRRVTISTKDGGAVVQGGISRIGFSMDTVQGQ
ncbi:MAG: hypothetical protein JNM17_00415 [Archangium sp.]|nr:hypothetical protein [Archangium sp.]